MMMICLFASIACLFWAIYRLHKKIDHLHDHLIYVNSVLTDFEPDDDDPDEAPEQAEPASVVAIAKRAA